MDPRSLESRRTHRSNCHSFTAALPKLVLKGFLIAMGLYLPLPINTLFRQVAAGLGNFHLLNYLPPPAGAQVGSAADRVGGGVQNPPTNMAA